MHSGPDFHFPGHKTLRKQQPAQITEHNSGIDPERAIQTATRAAGAFSIGRIHARLQKFIIHISLAFDYLAQGGLDFVGRNLFGVFVVGEIIKTAFGTQTAM
jgi:hypothetical protein